MIASAIVPDLQMTMRLSSHRQQAGVMPRQQHAASENQREYHADVERYRVP